jgi:hypothetical protein
MEGTANLIAVFGTALPAPTVTIESATGIGSSEVTFHGTVDPNGNPATWAFEYRAVGASTWQKTPQPEGDAGSGETAVDVNATVSGLKPLSEYEVRLRAANEASEGSSGIESFTTLGAPPSVSTGQAWSVSDTSATLVATVNPQNSEVTGCHFEYGSTSAYGQSAPCKVSPRSGGEAVQVLTEVHGLAPQAVYHFHLVASNGCPSGCGSRMGDDAAFVTRSSAEAAFPQRGYELVSAADSNGLSPYPDFGSPDGDAFDYSTVLPAPGAQNGAFSFFVSSRSPNGTWSQRYVGPAAPPPGNQIEVNSASGFMFSADLGKVVFENGAGTDADDQNGAPDVYSEDLATGALRWLSRDSTIPPGVAQTLGGQVQPPVYVSRDGKIVLFEAFRHLLPSDTSRTGSSSLYESDEGSLSLVGRIPTAGTECDDELSGQGCAGSSGGSELGSGFQRRIETTYGAVSRNGSRVLFEAEYPEFGGKVQLFSRVDGSRTVEISASAAGVEPPIISAENVSFAGADEEGGLIFFTSSSPLTPDSTAPGGTQGRTDLYEYDLADGSLRDLTPAAGGAGVVRVYFVSGDGHRIYFASAQLEGKGSGATPNLYLAELAPDGSLAKPLVLVAPVDAAEAATVVAGGGGKEAGGSGGSQGAREVAADPTGSVLAFRDRLEVVPGRSTAGQAQVFIYDVARNELDCASCPEGGGDPTSSANLVPAVPIGGAEAVAVGQSGERNLRGPHSRNVTSGGAVFFQTRTELVPGDRNDNIDVYEWRGGNVGLISPGTGSQDSMFGESSTDGSTVFFRSGSSLVPGAQLGVQHIYAARVGGGAPLVPTQAPACEGEDCRAFVPGSANATASPGSSSFVGPGDLRPHATKRKHQKRHHAKRRSHKHRHHARPKGSAPRRADKRRQPDKTGQRQSPSVARGHGGRR